MEKRLPDTRPEDTGLREVESPDVQELIRCLAEHVSHGITPSAPWESDGEAPEVLLDIEVDGRRYLLIRSPPKSPPAQGLLSPREEEIARMVAKGYPNKTIAAVLDISPWTVCTHLRRIFAKLGVCSRAAMVARLADLTPYHYTMEDPRLDVRPLRIPV